MAGIIDSVSTYGVAQSARGGKASSTRREGDTAIREIGTDRSGAYTKHGEIHIEHRVDAHRREQLVVSFIGPVAHNRNDSTDDVQTRVVLEGNMSSVVNVQHVDRNDTSTPYLRTGEREVAAQREATPMHQQLARNIRAVLDRGFATNNDLDAIAYQAGALQNEITRTGPQGQARAQRERAASHGPAQIRDGNNGEFAARITNFIDPQTKERVVVATHFGGGFGVQIGGSDAFHNTPFNSPFNAHRQYSDEVPVRVIEHVLGVPPSYHYRPHGHRYTAVDFAETPQTRELNQVIHSALAGDNISPQHIRQIMDLTRRVESQAIGQQPGKQRENTRQFGEYLHGLDPANMTPEQLQEISRRAERLQRDNSELGELPRVQTPADGQTAVQSTKAPGGR